MEFLFFVVLDGGPRVQNFPIIHNLIIFVNKAHLVSSVAPTDPLAERNTKDEFQ